VGEEIMEIIGRWEMRESLKMSEEIVDNEI
jgi:hypothetical protein